ncbi:MAG: hypothetical protein QOI63_90, partial [Thermoplasmata archaeon]|nr:hypothetical protein [Thermoplasmata archaeon]
MGMVAALLPAVVPSAEPVSHTVPAEWLMVAGPLVLLAAVVVALVVTGRPEAPGRWPFSWFRRAADSLERLTGMPAWASGGTLAFSWAIIIAGLGFYWDVAWHIDLGRDNALFTPAHVLILLGLGALGVAGLTSIVLASVQEAPLAWRLGPVRIPRGAAALCALGAGATLGFPLDDLWHASYGVDVTMWGPTHLLMIGGAAFSPIAAWLLLGEVGRDAGRPWFRRLAWGMAPVIVMVGLSAFQLEYDDGVPQWQALFQPVLIAMAATLSMVATRVARGRGAAVLATLGFLAVRAGFALIVGPGLGHVLPHVPLYLGIALCVEVAFVLTARRSVLVSALAAGGLAGTAGLASEWAFSHLWGRLPWQPSMLQGIWAAALMALAAAVLGAALGGAVGSRRRVVPGAVVGLAAVAAVVAMVVPLPRNTAPATAVLRTTPVGAPSLVVDHYNHPTVYQEVVVDLDVTPAAAVRDADTFWVMSWQGGGAIRQQLHEVSPGHWRAEGASPTGGSWKTIVFLLKNDIVMALPVAMPEDPQYGQAAIPVAAERAETFLPAS